MALYEVLESRFDEVLARWKGRVQGPIVPTSMPPLELLDHIPPFLREIAGLLHSDIDPSLPAVRRTAALHGIHRLRLGFSVDSIVREYGALHEAILQTASEAGTPVTAEENERITSSIIDGIAIAVAEYANRRDAELQRQHDEHLAFLSHELRNPLQAAVAAHGLLMQQPDAPNPRALESIGRALATMQDLIEGALRAAQAAAGLELRREHVQLASLIEETTLASETEADAAGVSLGWNVDHDGDLFIDPRLVRSALDNLVRNAVKYTKPGGHIEVRGRLDHRIVMEVEDACGGLPEDKIDRLFVPFVRLATEKSGFGLGLSIAKQAVEAHGGALRVQNLPGKGCIFTIELPRG